MAQNDAVVSVSRDDLAEIAAQIQWVLSVSSARDFWISLNGTSSGIDPALKIEEFLTQGGREILNLPISR